MTVQGTTNPEGWYADPVGRPQYRWWNGTVWTEHVYPYAYSRQVPRVEQRSTQPRLPEGTKLNSPWVWLISVLLVVSLIPLIFYFSGFGKVFAAAMTDPSATLALYTDPAYLLTLAVSYLVWGVTVVFAWLDTRWLRRAGLEQPFHWAWAFLSVYVYLIGRPIVASRAARGTYWPLWVYLTISVITNAVIIVVLTGQILEVTNLMMDITTRA